MKYLILILTVVIFENVNCQPISFCGSFPPHTANSQNPDSIYFDRFGNTYDIADSTSAIYSYSSAPGYFSVLSDLPNAYRGVVDSILADFSNIIQRRTNYTECGDPISKNLVNLKIFSAPDSPFLMAASPVWANFYNSCATGSFPMTTSNPYQILNYGRPSIFTGTDAILYLNTNVAWNLNFTNGPNSNEYDLRSVLLHELLHLFGFATLIKSNGTGTPMIGYDIYDHYLYYDKGIGPEKVILGNCMKNCWSLNPDITDFYKLVVDNCVVNNPTTLGIGSPIIAPLNGINSYTNQDPFNNYVAHLHPNCQNSNPDFIMQPTISLGERKIDITPEEISIICMLGYKIQTCDGCFIGVGLEPFGVEFIKCCTKIYSSCLNSAYTINFDDLLCNDEEDVTKTITDFYSQYNSNEISFVFDIISKTITITPKLPGSFRIYYTVTSCDCKQLNSYFDIYGYKCLDCSIVNPCNNLICSNGFEEFQVGQSFESLFSLGDNIYFTILKQTSNSPDICSYQNNKYLHLVDQSSGSNNAYIEGISLKLQSPIRKNNNIAITFKAAAHTRNTRVKILGSFFPPCSAIDYPIDTSCIGHPCPYDPVCLGELMVDNTNVFGATICPSSLSFKDYNLTVKNVFNKNLNYIVVIPSNEIDNNNYHLYLDNLVIQEVNSCESIGEIKQSCNQFEFEAQDCNDNIEVQWNFGDPNSGSNNVSLDNPATHIFSSDDLYTVTLTVSDSCGNTSTKIKTVSVICDSLALCACALSTTPGCYHLLKNNLISELFPPGISKLDDCCIIIKGKIVIDRDFHISNSTIWMEPGAEFEVRGGVHFTIDDYSHLLGCLKMWKSISCLSGSFFTMKNSILEDAEFGVHAFGGSSIQLIDNSFYQNYVGVFADGGAVNNSSPMIDNRFYTNGSFLPPYTGQINTPGANGYCGVLVKNAVFSVGASKAVNYFYDLYNGVIGQNSDLTVTKADIRDLITIRSRLSLPRKFSYPDGDGIFGNNCTLTAMANTISVTNGSIVDYQGKSMIAHDNIISNTVSGIYCAFPKVECYMDKNQITNYYLYGIGVSSPQTKIKLMITRTDPFTSATYNLQSGSTAIFLENVIANGLAQVQTNVMTLDPSSHGIVLKSCQKIGLQENSGAYSGITERNGIELATSPFNIVYKNSIVNYQPISSQGNAFYFMDSKSNKVCCNNSAGTRSGFHFSNASLMRNLFRTNAILDHQFGLHCDNGAQIDEQSNCGNEWHGYYSQDASAHFGSAFDIRESKHFVYNCNYPIWPPTIFPLQTCSFAGSLNTDWFQRRGDVPDPVCISDQSCVKPFNNIIRVIRGTGGGVGLGGFSDDDGTFNATDTIIATEGFIGNNSFETRTLWEMSYDFLYRLKLNPSIYEENSIMSDFVSDNQSSNLGKFVRLDLRLDTLISQLELQENQLQTHLYIVDSARSEIYNIDSIFLNHSLSEEDSLVLVNERMSWCILQLNSKLQIDTIIANYVILNEYGLDTLESFLSSITPTNIVEDNRKEVMTIYFNSSLRGHDTLTTDQFNIISTIANSCSRTGGRSVILARQLYLLNEYQEFNDDTICQYEPLPIVLGSETFKFQEEKLKVYPNPSNGNFIIELKNGNFTAGSELYIYDLNGREVYFKSIEKECVKVEINKNDLGLLEGVFLCKVISNSSVFYSPKIILNK